MLSSVRPPRSKIAAASAAAPKPNTTRRSNRYATAASNAKLAALISKAAAAPASKVASAAPAGPGSAAAVAVAPPPLYAYYTGLSSSFVDQPVYVAPITDWASVERTDFIRSNLESLIKENVGFCAGNVHEEYLEEHMPENEILVIISPDRIVETGRASKARPTVLPRCLGFIIARKVMSPRPKGIYLEIICTEAGKGTPLLKFFEGLAFHNGFGYIKLSSLANVLTYYSNPRLGYEFRKSCDGAALTELSARLKTRDFKIKPAPKDTAAAYENSNYIDFMVRDLHTKGLTVDDEGNCGIRPLSKTRFIESDCAADGFTMMRCSPDYARLPGPISGKRARRTRRATR